MSVYVDTADIEEIEQAGNYPFVDGVTTNPKLISKALKSSSVSIDRFLELIKRIGKSIDGDIFVQTNYQAHDLMIEEAGVLHDILGDRLVMKIPLTLPGLQAIKDLNKKEIRTAATAVFTGVQAYLAMKCGAEFVVPYYSRIMHSMHDGLDVVDDILQIIEHSDYDCKILVASLKSTFHVLEVIRAGVQCVTMPADLLASLLVDQHTFAAVQEFQHSLEIVG